MRFSVLAFAASLMTACVVYAQAKTAAYPTVPTANTKWKAGTEATVEWKLTDPKDQTAMVIRLYHGDPAKMIEDAVLGTAPAGATSFKITVPANLKSDYYSIRVGNDDSYSHYFIIEGTGPVPTGPPPVPGSGNPTSAVPSASASATKSATSTPNASPSVTKSPTPTPTGAAGALKAGSLALGAAVVVAAAFAF